MNFCPYCGSQLTEAKKFCGNCGKELFSNSRIEHLPSVDQPIVTTEAKEQKLSKQRLAISLCATIGVISGFSFHNMWIISALFAIAIVGAFKGDTTKDVEFKDVYGLMLPSILLGFVFSLGVIIQGVYGDLVAWIEIYLILFASIAMPLSLFGFKKKK